MRRGLSCAGEWAFNNPKNKQYNKNYPVGEKQEGGLARQDRARQDTCNDELARDCKHKEIIKGENEEGNEENTGGAN